MSQISLRINDIIYFLLRNMELIKQKNKIFDVYIRNNKEINISTVEIVFFKSKSKTRTILDQIIFWSDYTPFNQDFLLYCSIYFIFEDKFDYIKNLLIIKNSREIFHYIRQLWFRNTVGYYNEEDFDFEIDILIKKIEGIVLEEDLSKNLNEDYYFISDIYIKNKKAFENLQNNKFIEKEQIDNEIFKKSFCWDL